MFEYANGVSFSAGGSGGAATVSISGEFNMGKQMDQCLLVEALVHHGRHQI